MRARDPAPDVLPTGSVKRALKTLSDEQPTSKRTSVYVEDLIAADHGTRRRAHVL